MFRRSVDAVEIVPGLWLGSAPSARQARDLHERGIEAVVDLRAERDGDAVVWPPEVEVRVAQLRDHGTPYARQLEGAAAVVADLMAQGRTVLVHCHAGIERAPTVACAALLLQGWTLDAAYQRVITSRPRALPTEGQLAALRELQANRSRLAQR